MQTPQTPTHSQQERERERESKNGADNQNLASQTQNSQSLNFTNSVQNSQIPQNLNQNSQISTPTNTPKNSLENYKKLDYNSLSDDEKSEGYVFHILTDTISESTRQKLENLAQALGEIYLCEIAVHLCENLPDYANSPTYFRLFIPKFMPQSAKMCLYLDGDMLVMQDLRALFALDLSGKAAAVVKENVWVVRTACRFNKNYKKLKKFREFYFNAGFLLMNLRAWGEQGILEKCLEFFDKHGKDLVFLDQDALNYAISQDKALVLPFAYNLFGGVNSTAVCKDDRANNALDYTRFELNFALTNPAVWHFVGIDKAWNNAYSLMDGEGIFLGVRWWDIALQTPQFADELRPIFEAMQSRCLPLLAFKNYVGTLILRCAQGFWGYFKLPFVVYRAFRDYERGKLVEILANFTPNFNPNEQNLALGIFGEAKRAYEKRLKGRLLDFPHRVWRLKLRFERYGSAKILAENKVIFG